LPWQGIADVLIMGGTFLCKKKCRYAFVDGNTGAGTSLLTVGKGETSNMILVVVLNIEKDWLVLLF
jgi:hypothetical protein